MAGISGMAGTRGYSGYSGVNTVLTSTSNGTANWVTLNETPGRMGYATQSAYSNEIQLEQDMFLPIRGSNDISWFTPAGIQTPGVFTLESDNSFVNFSNEKFSNSYTGDTVIPTTKVNRKNMSNKYSAADFTKPSR